MNKWRKKSVTERKENNGFIINKPIKLGLKLLGTNIKHNGQRSLNVSLRRVRVIIVAV
jgi:hypothetical protein